MFQIVREPDFAKRVADCRGKIGLTQSECARKLGVRRQHWSNWEFGYCKPTKRRMGQLAILLKCDPEWLQHGDGTQIEQKIRTVMYLMRAAVRELDHIHEALHEP